LLWNSQHCSRGLQSSPLRSGWRGRYFSHGTLTPCGGLIGSHIATRTKLQMQCSAKQKLIKKSIAFYPDPGDNAKSKGL
jgi:hypothetical protein